MRTVSLAKVAAKPEMLRLQRQGRRTGLRVAYAVVAGVFITAALAGAHVAAVMALMTEYQPVTAVLIVVGADVVIAVVLGLMASRNVPDAIEREALEIERRALAQLRESMAIATVVGPAMRLLGTRKAYGITLAALTARYLGSRR